MLTSKTAGNCLSKKQGKKEKEKKKRVYKLQKEHCFSSNMSRTCYK
jgi:hypothetical protein